MLDTLPNGRSPECLNELNETTPGIAMVVAVPVKHGRHLNQFATRIPLWSSWSELKARMDEVTQRSGADEILFEFYSQRLALIEPDPI